MHVHIIEDIFNFAYSFATNAMEGAQDDAMQMVEEVVAQEVIKGIKLTMIKKMILPEYEQLCCDMLEVVTGWATLVFEWQVNWS